MSVTATIFNIERASLNDGYGIRTVVYLKGCPLECKWCHNPEGLSFKRQIAYYRNRCVHCNSCVNTCPEGCYSFKNDKIERNYTACTMCGRCAENCPTNALAILGKDMTTDEVLSEIMKDKAYFDKSGGGVTFSGGECLVHDVFMHEMLILCRENGIHTLIESSCGVPWTKIERVASVADMFYVDIKHMDSYIHKKYTGMGNELILENIKKLSKITKSVLVRIPLIPGVNDSDNNLLSTYEFTVKCGFNHIMLLRYNTLGESKYNALDKEFYCPPNEQQTAEEVKKRCEELNRSIGVPEFFISD